MSILIFIPHFMLKNNNYPINELSEADLKVQPCAHICIKLIYNYLLKIILD